VNVALIHAGPDHEFRELAEAMALVTMAGCDVVHIAVNDSGAEHPEHLSHWCSLHPEQFRKPKWCWEQRREANGLNTDYVRWGQSRIANIDRVVRNWKGGSSGLLALDVALNGVDCDAAILCGVRMNEDPNPMNGRWKDAWTPSRRFWPAWKRHMGAFRERTRSMSGRTMEELGRPTLAWLRSF
jgi:hypothetical protein